MTLPNDPNVVFQHKEKPPKPSGDGGIWRRVGDSNPRTAFDRYTISNRAQC